ncbi:CvpA family protein [Roseospira marina]|nr:CvpA family protein [Roseospira marina]MBB4316152.1 membrane protein required for colicin V production [Roseospira marina]MBB5089344.1 membrane protein required for colicin V production [Roseospira marina]
MENWPVNPVDIAVLFVLVVSAALAFFRGFVHEVLGIGAWIGAILAAIYALPEAQPYVRAYIPIDWLADLVTAVGIFLVVLVVLSVLTALIARRVQDSALNALDRTLGFLFGLARGGVLVLVLYVAASWLVPRDTQPDWVMTARSMPMIQQGADTMVALLPPELLPASEVGPGAAPAATTTGGGSGTTPQNPGLDAQRAFEALRRPQAGTEEGRESGGYAPDERQGMDRLMESTQ